MMAASSKSALSLLQEYDSSDSSEDEVPGAKVSTKRTAPKEWQYSPEKKENEQEARLPLPAVLKTKATTIIADPCIDNPEKHEGRIRSFPHERGNWSTFIYIPYSISPSVQSFIDVVLVCMGDIDIRSMADLHISLTKTVVLRHHWIDLFIKSIQETVKSISRIQASFGGVKVYCNEEKTRTFVGLEVSRGSEELEEVTKALDICLAEFKLPPYYNDPSFHLSIAWTHGDLTEQMSKFVPQLDVALQQFVHVNAVHWDFEVTKFMCKTGNKYFSFPLSA